MRKRKYMRVIVVCLAIAVLVGAFFATGPGNGAQAVTFPPPPATIVYDLYATDGNWTMADGTQIYSYGYVGGREGSTIQFLLDDGSLSPPTVVPAPTAGPVTAAEAAFAGHAQFPAPLIYCRARDVVIIKLKNLGTTLPTAPNDPHSVHLHGLDVDAANDGVPETSVAAVPANSGLPGAGNVVVYMFSPKLEGTYFYHCHQEADIHVTMGMYGALVVYNRTDAAADTGPGMGKGGTLWGWKYDKDYVMLLSDTDIRQHASEAGTGFLDYNPVDYTPQYWFINGISFPDTIHASTPGFDWSNWSTAHPGYDPFISGSVSANRGSGEKVLVRMINMGFETQPMHVHGFHFKILGSDQRPWRWANFPGLNPTGTGLEKNTITIGSGEEYDLLFDFGVQKVTSTYNPDTQSRYDTQTNLPVSNTQTGNPAIPVPNGGGVTYIGGPTVAGAVGIQGINSQLFPFHNHDDYKATNFGTYPGGMFTLVMPLP